jgi:hypothetical protein
MKKILPIILFSVSLLFSGGTFRAWAQEELASFQKASGDESVLFRGKQATRISFPANGNPYWDQPTFVRGNIVFEENLYRDVFLNIDAREQRALVQKSYGLQSIALTPAQTPSLTMGDRRFVGMGPGEALPEGFYEVFGTGPELVYKHVEKVLQSSVNDVNGSGIGYYDEHYRSDVYRYFAYNATYYFRNEAGEFTRIKSKGALLRQFKDRKKEIRKSLKANRNNSDTSFDAYCKAVLKAAAR